MTAKANFLSINKTDNFAKRQTTYCSVSLLDILKNKKNKEGYTLLLYLLFNTRFLKGN